MEVVLSIAGSDPCAGAGIQQDLKTITALDCYGSTVITALTVQNTLGVQDVVAVSGNLVARQLRAVVDDLDVKAIKIGQLPNQEVITAVTEVLQDIMMGHRIPIVYDPVMISTSGKPLMEAACVETVRQQLFPLCTLITPNLPETEVLIGREIRTPEAVNETGRLLTQRYHTAFLLKGGHADEQRVTDRLYTTDGTTHNYDAARIISDNLHGTGCTLSSAIAAELAKGQALPVAVAHAKEFIEAAIRRSVHHGIGHGNGPLLVG